MALPQLKWGLRAKSTLAVCGAIAMVLLAAGFAGVRFLRIVEENLGSAYARNVTLYNKQRILAPVLRELTLAQRLADSEVTHRWLKDPDDPAARALFFAEAERYRTAFADHSYFIASADGRYFFNDRRTPFSDRPRYRLDRANPKDDWFFGTLRAPEDFNLNVNTDRRMKVTKVWFNVLVRDHGRAVGLAGTGLDLSRFLTDLMGRGTEDRGVTPMFLDHDGSIQAHPDRRLIVYNVAGDASTRHNTVYTLLDTPREREYLRNALQRAQAQPDTIPLVRAHVGGLRELLAVSYVPELGWYAVTAIDLQSARVVDRTLWLAPLLLGVGLLVLLVLAIVAAVNRTVLAPLLRLTDGVRALSGGRYTADLPPAGSDEIGEMTRAFSVMVEKVRSHTEELEATVRERTRDLVAANGQLEEANRKMTDSIACASLIQNALLPFREMEQAFGQDCFVLWRPRDTVAGDCCVFYPDGAAFLLGVIDCAGHGVPGAFMTMIAYTLLNGAVDALGIEDPAALLRQVDALLRTTLGTDQPNSPVASQMDAGLAYVDRKAGTVTYAGARLSLYCADRDGVRAMPGQRHALGDRRGPCFSNSTAPLVDGATYYLATDGMLDQSGGEAGFSLGRARFTDMLARHSAHPVAEQKAAFEEDLVAYQDGRPQRDDITLIGFRIPQSIPPQPIALQPIPLYQETQ